MEGVAQGFVHMIDMGRISHAGLHANSVGMA